MPDYHQIYRRHADQYELLVSREDRDGNLIRALNGIRPLAGLDVVELGAGTGRVTRLAAPLVRRIYAFDASAPMLRVGVERLSEGAGRALSGQDPSGQSPSGRGPLRDKGWLAGAADHRALPLPAGVADLAVAGWTLGHFTGWYPDRWGEEIGRALGEVARVLRPGGTAIIIETLGTGQASPSPPNEALAAYYAWLEEGGYCRTWVRTDFRFRSRAEAERLLRFFFTDLYDERLAGREDLVDLPECTGLWWRTI
jgi:ubiquinone/menaquinone biosynthesis C-methylase UbiE